MHQFVHSKWNPGTCVHAMLSKLSAVQTPSFFWPLTLYFLQHKCGNFAPHPFCLPGNLALHVAPARGEPVARPGAYPCRGDHRVEGRRHQVADRGLGSICFGVATPAVCPFSRLRMVLGMRREEQLVQQLQAES